MKAIVTATAFFICFQLGGTTWAQAGKKASPASLDQLLQQVRKGYRSQSEEDKQREREFTADKSKQQALLKKARATMAREQKRGEKMEKEFDRNEALMAQLEETLRLRLGNMGELFGVIRQVAGDVRNQVDSSMVSAQFPGRGDKIIPLTQSKVLPSVKQLELLWYTMQHEMTESGKIVRFKTGVVTAAGVEEELDVIRLGVFNAVTQGKYLKWEIDVSKLVELARQPPDRMLGGVAELETAKEGYVRFAVDPSRGQILGLLVLTPDFVERVQLGGTIGYIIMILGAVTALLTLIRMLVLLFVSIKVGSQRKSKEIKKNNPLGRILSVYQENTKLDSETLERKMDEAILRESARLERFLWAVKIVSVVAPLLGLLGTVTGMIQTFQAITLFGTGDPKLMADGISVALVTTMLGLIVAIPLVLLHSWLKSMSRRVMDVLEEQSAGIVARRAEQEKACDTAAD